MAEHVPSELPKAFHDSESGIVEQQAKQPVLLLHDLLQPSLFNVHLPPLQVENVTCPETGIDRNQNPVAQVGRGSQKQPSLLFRFRQEPHQPHRIRALMLSRPLRRVEHVLEKPFSGSIAAARRTSTSFGNFNTLQQTATRLRYLFETIRAENGRLCGTGGIRLGRSGSCFLRF
jgi:hypothetical protein